MLPFAPVFRKAGSTEIRDPHKIRSGLLTYFFYK